MFEHVLIPVISAAEDTEGPVDLGQLVEAMLFYGRVSLAINGLVTPCAAARVGAERTPNSLGGGVSCSDWCREAVNGAQLPAGHER